MGLHARTDSVEDSALSAAAAAGGGASSAGACSNRASSTLLVMRRTPRPPGLPAPGFFAAPKRGLAAGGFLAAAPRGLLKTPPSITCPHGHCRQHALSCHGLH